MWRGLRLAAGEDDQTVAPSLNIVKHVCVAAVDSCRKTDRDSRGQSRQPRVARAERNGASAERLERASCEPHNHRATAEDRDVDLRAFNGAAVHESDDDVYGCDTDSVAGATTSLAAGVAGQAVQNGGRSRHGTALDRLAGVVVLCGRHRAPPVAHVRQLAALIELAGSIRPPQRTLY
jgi:hypothetical protein